jgi:hypothetical protein
VTAGPPSNPPGMPPPSNVRGRGYDSSSSSSEGSAADEVRLLDILTREPGEVSLGELHYRSGLTSDRLRFWLDELDQRGVIEIAPQGDETFVALKGKMGAH